MLVQKTMYTSSLIVPDMGDIKGRLVPEGDEIYMIFLYTRATLLLIQACLIALWELVLLNTDTPDAV